MASLPSEAALKRISITPFFGLTGPNDRSRALPYPRAFSASDFEPDVRADYTLRKEEREESEVIEQE